ncbi:fructose-1,6-bisphosphatase [Carnobacteriaceae bacterium zg-84]|uniref:fructose-1,6-bisphosphatase n=1 Tax=Granulicatella sp. zg-84 TaxID=2678503 RepID=UPI0013C0BDEB|nr:fructose-1,6-bisphosphatase [Granulicatella sp. zg-84]NEW66758.1 fructose-bisphosphatase class III [Granulicatella sp. zg-84]QMI85974.1 fructose-1,6-bisphosphatase [Carnobacteriaceae bacterium zg-84]
MTATLSNEDIITEIINLEAILNLPKGTEHFVSDVHGEYFAFQYILRNASGNVRAKLNDLFGGRLTTSDISQLTTLIVYPEEKLSLIQDSMEDSLLKNWYAVTIYRLIEFLEFVASKYTRSKVRKALPSRFVYIIEELLYKSNVGGDKQKYYSAIVDNLIALEQADDLIIALSYVMQQLIVDHLHVVGDIYDRGPAPDEIMETLMHYHSVDIQWGNHDILWLGAVSGSLVCMANVIRICARYNNLSIIEDSYGINLRPLFTYAEKYYKDFPNFRPKLLPNQTLGEEEAKQISKLHQAITFLQFKLESQIIKRRPEFDMANRRLLTQIDTKHNTITLDGKEYPLQYFDTSMLNDNDPEALTDEERHILAKLNRSFQNSEKLKRHMDFLLEVGSLYTLYNGNLLYHGCVPLTENEQFASLTLENQKYHGKALFDKFESYVRYSAAHPHIQDDFSTDMMWYLWTGKYSSLFGKDVMKTFERYFIQDKETHAENKNKYYSARENLETVKMILKEFGVPTKDGHIINGHTPVKEIKGECPIKANGKMIVIDGGFSLPYHKTTGIHGYTLLYNSYGMQLITHKHFDTKEVALREETDVLSTKRIVDRVLERKRVRDTTVGKRLQDQINTLYALLNKE